MEVILRIQLLQSYRVTITIISSHRGLPLMQIAGNPIGSGRLLPTAGLGAATRAGSNRYVGTRRVVP